MKAVCVDDEVQVLKHIVSSCRKISLLDDVKGFPLARDALEYISDNPVDLVLLDIDMPDMSGLELAGRIREIIPRVPIIFITAYSEYALSAYDVHPVSYLLKPFDQAKLTKEVEYALSARDGTGEAPRIVVQTFGNFEILVNGRTMNFRRSKSKELLAYLVDRRGAGVTRKEVFSTLWEDRMYDVSMQKQVDVVIRSLRETLQNYGIADLFELKNRSLRIRPELLDCDMYRFLEGDEEARGAYFGEYMSQYTWAADMEAQLTGLQNNRMKYQKTQEVLC